MATTADDRQTNSPEDSLTQLPCTHHIVAGEGAGNDFQSLSNYSATPFLSNSLLNSAPTTPLLQLDQGFDIPNRGQSETFNVDPLWLQDGSMMINPDCTIDPSMLTSGQYQSPFVVPPTLPLSDPFMSPPTQQKRGRIASITRPVVVTNNIPVRASVDRHDAVDYQSLAAAHISDPTRRYSSGLRSMQQYLANRQAIDHPQYLTPGQCRRCNESCNVDPPVDLMRHQQAPVTFPTFSTWPKNNYGSNTLPASNDSVSINRYNGQDTNTSPYHSNTYDQRISKDLCYDPLPASDPNAFDTYSNSAGSNINVQTCTNGQRYGDYSHIPQQRSFFYNEATFAGNHWDLLIINGQYFTLEEGCLIVALQRDLGLDSDTVSEILKFHREDFTPLPPLHFSAIMEPTQNIQISHVQQETILRREVWQQSAKQAYEGWLRGMGELIARMESSNFDNCNETGNIFTGLTNNENSNDPHRGSRSQVAEAGDCGSPWIWETRLSQELSAAEKGKGHESGNDNDQDQNPGRDHNLSRDQMQWQEPGKEDAPAEVVSETAMQVDGPAQEERKNGNNRAPSEAPEQKDIQGSWVPSRLLSGVFSPQ